MLRRVADGQVALFFFQLVIFIVTCHSKKSSELNYKAVTKLCFAAAYGNVSEINRLVEAGGNVNERDWVGQTPLHMAAKFGRVASLDALLQHGADPRLVNSEYNETPLHIIAKVAFVEAFHMLLSRGAKLDAVVDIGDFSGGTPLNYAVLVSNSVEAAKYLIESGANVNAANLHDQTPLHQAVQNENMLMIKLLLSYGANVTKRDGFGNTVLHFAMYHQEPFAIIAKFLLNNGADVFAKDKNGKTPLHIAIGTGSLELIQLLLDAGADPYAPDAKGMTAINVAYGLRSKQERKQQILQLLERSNNPTKRAIHQIHVYACHNDVQRLKVILSSADNASRLINIDTRDFYNRTALHTAAHCQSVEAAKTLLNFGANPNALPENNYLAPLHLAAKSGNIEMISLLIERGADVNAGINVSVSTPLVLAAEHANAFIPAARLLLESGALISASDSGGEQAIHKAILNQNIKLAEELIKYGADVNALTTSRTAPITTIIDSYCCYPQIPVIGWLIDHGADVNIRDNQGLAPIHHAILTRKRKEVVEYLLYRGADPNAVDKSNCNSPLYLAVKQAAKGLDAGPINMMDQHGTAELVAVLIKYGSDVNAIDNCRNTTAIQLLESSSLPESANPNLYNVLSSARLISLS